MTICQQEEREAGRAYPRTCPTCRFGPCQKYGRTPLATLDALRAENERLRADLDLGAKDYCNLMDQRDALAVRVEKLELALRPFVEYVHDDFRRGKATYELVAADRAGGLIGAEDLRRARAALAQKGGEA